MRIPSANLLDAAGKILLKQGVPGDQAAIIAKSLVEADLRGVDSHGLSRLPSYIRRVKAGVMVAVTRVTVVRDGECTSLLDGGNGFGQVAGMAATRLAAEKASRHGLGAVGVRNSNHFGTAAFYTMEMARAGLIGWAVCNAAPAMSPFGGTRAMLGTNPLSVAIPAGREQPVVLDMATTVVARGKIRQAARKGEKIPPHWAQDREGRPSTDPVEALGGTLLGIGGPKGYGLALLIDILSGLLTGGAFGEMIRETTNLSGPCGTGFMIGAFDPGRFTEVEEFRSRMDDLIHTFRNSPAAPGHEKVYLPGELEYLKSLENEKRGISLAENVLVELKALAEECQVDWQVLS